MKQYIELRINLELTIGLETRAKLLSFESFAVDSPEVKAAKQEARMQELKHLEPPEKPTETGLSSSI